MSFTSLFKSLDSISLISVILAIYVTQYYYKYFTRVNPLPGPFPFPLIGNLPQFIYYGRNFKPYLEYNHKKYGDLYEIHLGIRRIIINRAEYIEKLLTPSTKSQYMMRFPYTKGLDELGVMDRGLIFNHDLKSWRYNRQFFTQAILSPKFTQEVIDWTNRLFNELEGYWNKLYLKNEIIEANKNQFDFSAWLNRYTNDMIIALITGQRSYTMAAYFNTQGVEKTLHPPAIIDDSERFVQNFRKFVLGAPIFIVVPPFFRRYVPFLKSKSDDVLQKIKYIHQKLDEIIKKRRQLIENTPMDKPLPHDMLTSVIIANTPRDINYIKTVGGEAMDRPMTDIEIRGIMFDGFLGGTDTVNKLLLF